MTYKCSNCSKDSTDPEFCSECNAQIVEASANPVAKQDEATTPPAPATTAGSGKCPECGASRLVTAIFCRTCGYDFVKQESIGAGNNPFAPPASIAPFVTPSIVQTAPLTRVKKWDVLVAVDASLFVPSHYDQPETIVIPPNEPVRTYPLEQKENLLGRTSKDLRPDVLIVDKAVSRKQGKLICPGDGSLSLLILTDNNNTQLVRNGQKKDVATNVETPLEDGDQLTMGAFTRITIRARS